MSMQKDLFAQGGCISNKFVLFSIIKSRNSVFNQSGPEAIKLFSSSTQFSMEFQLLIKTKTLTKKDFSGFQILTCCIYHANKCYNANNCWHFNIYGHDKCFAQLS